MILADPERGDGAGREGRATRDGDLFALAGLVGLGARNEKGKAGRRPGHMVDVKRDQFGPAEGSGEGKQEQGAIAKARECGAADRGEAFDFVRGQRGGPAGA